MVAPDVYLYKEHRRHGERLAIEDSRHYFATAPFYLFLVIHTLCPVVSTSSMMIISFPLIFPVMR